MFLVSMKFQYGVQSCYVIYVLIKNTCVISIDTALYGFGDI